MINSPPWLLLVIGPTYIAGPRLNSHKRSEKKKHIALACTRSSMCESDFVRDRICMTFAGHLIVAVHVLQASLNMQEAVEYCRVGNTSCNSYHIAAHCHIAAAGTFLSSCL